MREGGKGRCPTCGEGVRTVRVYEPFAWWLTRERIGQDLRERYAVAQELPPHLLALLKKLDAVEGNPFLSALVVTHYFLQSYLVLWSRHQRGQSTTLFCVLLVLFYLAHSPRLRPSLFGNPR